MPELYLKEIRRALRWGERAMAELVRIQDLLPSPAGEELTRMIAGEIPLSPEAYVLAVLQYGVFHLEQGTLDVRVSLHADNFRKAERRRQRRGHGLDLATALKAVIAGRDGR
jgi:hypothetical protein